MFFSLKIRVSFLVPRTRFCVCIFLGYWEFAYHRRRNRLSRNDLMRGVPQKSVLYSLIHSPNLWNQSINQSCIFRVVQVRNHFRIHWLRWGNDLTESMTMSWNKAWKRNVFRRWRKIDRDEAQVTLFGRLLQMVSPATGKIRQPTVDSFMDGTSRRLVEQNWGNDD